MAQTAERRVRVAGAEGLHARPAGAFVQAAGASGAAVTLARPGGEPVDARSILSVLGLDVSQGDDVILSVTGDDAERVANELAAVLAAEG